MVPRTKGNPRKKSARDAPRAEQGILAGAGAILGGLQDALDHLAEEFGRSFQALDSLSPTSRSKSVSIEVTREGFRYVLIRTPCSKGKKLSPREGEVAELAAAGIPNSEIARRLRIRRPTVATHIRSIYRKLGVTSRIQLAQMFPPKRSRGQ